MQSPIDYLMNEVRELRRGHDILRRDSQRRSRQLTSFIQYSTEFNASLTQIMDNCSLNTGPSPVQFLARPIFYGSDEDEADNADI